MNTTNSLRFGAHLEDYIGVESGAIKSEQLTQSPFLTTLFSLSEGEGMSMGFFDGPLLYYVLSGDVHTMIKSRMVRISDGEALLVSGSMAHAMAALTDTVMLTWSFPKNTPVRYFPENTPFVLSEQIDVHEACVVDQASVQQAEGDLALFAFDAGTGLDAQSSNGNAVVLVLDGDLDVSVADDEYMLSAGDAILVPKGVPHALNASSAAKMLLTTTFFQE